MLKKVKMFSSLLLIGAETVVSLNQSCLEIEEAFPAFQFIEVDRDQFIDVAAEWSIFGIPSFVVIENGQELGRLVNKDRKTKEEISAFLTSLG